MSIEQLPYPPPRSSDVFEPGTQKFHQIWSGWFRRIAQVVNGNLSAGYTGTITLAKLTTGGTNGSISVDNGIITSVSQPT